MSLTSTLTPNVDAGAYQARYAAAVQPVVGAPVIAVGLVARHGGAVRTRGRRKALRLPSSVMLAVTPSHLHALSYDFKNGGTVVVGEVARWERNGLRADVDHTPACKVLSITLGDGTRVEFESMWGEDVNHGLFAVLLHPVS